MHSQLTSPKWIATKEVAVVMTIQKEGQHLIPKYLQNILLSYKTGSSC